jgi:hypothetical protein
VQIILGSQHGLDDLNGRARGRAVHGCHIVESPDAAGDAARRRPLQGRDDADDVAVTLGGDVDDLEHRRVDLVDGLLGRVRDDLAEHLVAGDHHEPDGMDGCRRTGRKHRPLDAALAAVVQERPDVGEVPELGLVDRRLCAGGEPAPDLSEHETDVVGRNLDPIVALHAVDGPQLETEARHQEVGLETGLAFQGEDLVGCELPPDALGDQADL